MTTESQQIFDEWFDQHAELTRLQGMKATTRLIWNHATRAEREACAKLCDEYDDDCGPGEAWGPRFGSLIRERK